VLNITQVDPIKYGLLFERFLVKYKKSFPDIDCLHENTLVKISDNEYKYIKDLNANETILDHTGKKQKVLFVSKRKSNNADKLYQIFIHMNGTYGSILTTSKHRLLNESGEQVHVEQINQGDRLHSLFGEVVVLKKKNVLEQINLVDITVEENSTFQFVPYNCCVVDTGKTKFLVSNNDYSVDINEYKQILENGLYEENERDGRIIKL
jgi:hypothetical protein